MIKDLNLKQKLTRMNFIIPLIFIFFILNNCQYFQQLYYKEWQEAAGINNKADIYIGGFYNDGNYHPCYWKNDELVSLGSSVGISSSVESIFVDLDDVYCGGLYYHSQINACYWLNKKQIKVELDDPANISTIYSIYVAGGVVFACGFEREGINDRACYWINGEKYLLNTPSDAVSSKARAIVADINTLDFYITGYYDNGIQNACYWKNGDKCVILPNPYGNDCYTRAGILYNGNFYIGGYSNNGNSVPCYWVNKKYIELPYNDYGEVYGMVVNDGNVYFTGRNNIGGFAYPALWKNKSLVWMDSSINNNYSYGIAVYDKNVYLTGYSAGSIPYFWENGNKTTIIASGQAKCITVKRRDE